ncbi:hypothetical protein [Actinomadura macrotermitis]|uniref:PQQ-like domain-containing protein n=1 Tax=Actinomadura macrotermitis TaxID=2585200 RepID=A0A7K0C163_9ACTN|nr:hypothetical protein [Actinomadura macrotermitis]MQY07201.1 hypothetical protein [Actinomadura macrotermitis]
MSVPDPGANAGPAPGEAPRPFTGPVYQAPPEQDEPWLRPAPPPARPARPAAKVPGTRRRFERRVMLLGAGSALAVSVLVAGGFSLLRDDDGGRPAPTAAPSPSATARFNRQVPPGWSDRAAWQAAIRPGTRPAIADGGMVALVTNDRRLQLRHGATGAVIWTTAAALPPDAAGEPVATHADGRPVIAVQAGQRLLLWPVNGTGADPLTLDLPDKARLSWAGDGPLLTLPGREAALVSGGRIVRVTLPGQAVAMAVDGTGVLAATGKGLWWRVAPGAAPVKIVPKAPAGARAVTRVAAAGHGTVALVWSARKGGDAVAALHDAVSGQVRAAAAAPAAQLRAPVWARGADGAAAALGPVLFDLGRPAAVARPGFSPLTAAGPTLYGRIGKRLVAVPAAAPAAPADLPQGTALPWGIAAERVIVADRTADGVALFALPPR